MSTSALPVKLETNRQNGVYSTFVLFKQGFYLNICAESNSLIVLCVGGIVTVTTNVNDVTLSVICNRLLSSAQGIQWIPIHTRKDFPVYFMERSEAFTTQWSHKNVLRTFDKHNFRGYMVFLCLTAWVKRKIMN